MQALRRCLGILGTLALISLPSLAGAQPVGSEFQINTYTTGSQRTGYFAGNLVAADATGNFIVVWRSYGQDGSSDGIFCQRYDSEGVPLAREFRVNSYTTSFQGSPSVAAAGDGAFAVVWASDGQDGSNFGIFGQRYDSGGVAQGDEFQVNSFTGGRQGYPSIASDASGNLVVIWEGSGQDDSIGVFGQRYDSAGVALGAEFRVNSYTISTQDHPSAAADASGNFVVVWESYAQDGHYEGIFGQRYDSAGVPRGGEFQVNTSWFGNQAQASVASDAGGNFVVVWADYRLRYGYPNPIVGQRYDSEGVPLGSEFVVNSYTLSAHYSPAVASDADGNFVVAWSSFGQDGRGYGNFGQRYNNAGVAQGVEFQINSFTTNNQRSPSVRATATNQFVVAWESYGQDGSGYGVFGQPYDFGGAITVVSPNTNVKWRIGSLQKIQWLHNLGADATFRIELDRDDDGTFEELIADDAPVDNATKGSFAWTVTGPRSGMVRVRVAWTDDFSVSDSSDVTFQIRPVG